MDLEQIKHLPDDMKQRYSDLERMFSTPGWALIEETFKQRAEGHQQRELSSQNWDHTLLNRGARLAFQELANLREATEQEFSAISEQQALRAQLEDEIDHE
jgi:hypothetical protein